MRHLLRTVRNDTLLLNALYLMVSTFVMAGTGFIFWILIARAYDPATVGLATTLLSVSGLLSLLGLAGFDATFIRFLPRSDRKKEYINSGFVVVVLVSGVLSATVAALLPMLSPHLAVLEGVRPFAAFVFFTIVAALNLLANAIFLAHKRARATLFSNIIFGGLKIGLALMVMRGGAMTIFILIGLSQLCGLLFSIGIVRYQLHHSFSPRVHRDILRISRKYSLVVYISSILNLLPPTLLPLIIVHQLGPENAAYYYMAFTIAGVLYTISYASMQSAFAEGSHDEQAMRNHVRKAVKLVALLLLPAGVLVALLSSHILGVFGQDYVAKGSLLLQLFTVSAVPVAIYSAMGAVFKVVQQLRGIIVMNVAYAATILSLSYWFVPRFGIVAVGWSWLAGNAAAIGIGWLFLRNVNSNEGGLYGTTA